MGQSPHSARTDSTVPVNRRQFLRRCGLGVAVTAIAPAALASATETRTLNFVHTHTGEKLRAVYSKSGCYQADCLQQVNHFLRDFRTGEVHTIDPALLDVLYDLQVLADREAAFQIISGYRSPLTNAQLRGKSKSSGVATHSLHMDGLAVDVRLSGFDTAKLHKLAMSLQRGGVGYYRDSDFVHVDTGRVRYW